MPASTNSKAMAQGSIKMKILDPEMDFTAKYAKIREAIFTDDEFPANNESLIGPFQDRHDKLLKSDFQEKWQRATELYQFEEDYDQNQLP